MMCDMANKHAWINERTNERTDGRTDQPTDGPSDRTNERTKEPHSIICLSKTNGLCLITYYYLEF